MLLLLFFIYEKSNKHTIKMHCCFFQSLAIKRNLLGKSSIECTTPIFAYEHKSRLYNILYAIINFCQLLFSLCQVYFLNHYFFYLIYLFHSFDFLFSYAYVHFVLLNYLLTVYLQAKP